jgi:hypothetical protein
MEALFVSRCLSARQEWKVFRRELPLGLQIHLNIKLRLGALSPFVQELFDFGESSCDLFIPRQHVNI